jgi:hypothetical protein
VPQNWKTSFQNIKKIGRGLTQEAATSTTLFSARVNDLTVQLEKIKNVKPDHFADDLTIWISLPKCQEHQVSQTMNEALQLV